MTFQQAIIASSTPKPYRFNSDDYMLLDRSGAFRAHAKTELLGGVIVAVNAQFSKHIRVQSRLHRAIGRVCDDREDGLEAWVEGSIDLADDSMPQPDIFLTRTLPDDGPVPLASVALIVEVADSSLDFDLGIKAELYASAGIAEYWVADVNARVVHLLTNPSIDGYADAIETAFGQPLEAITIRGLTIDTGSL